MMCSRYFLFFLLSSNFLSFFFSITISKNGYKQLEAVTPEEIEAKRFAGNGTLDQIVSLSFLFFLFSLLHATFFIFLFSKFLTRPSVYTNSHSLMRLVQTSWVW